MQGSIYDFRKRSIKDAKPVVEEADLHKIAESLEEDVKGLGGAWFIESIFDVNKRLYDASMQRVHFVRRYESIPTVENCTPDIPYGYLLNLAVKHSQRPPNLLKADERNVALKRVIEASRHFAALYDVQNYYQLSVLLQSTNSIVGFVQDTALYDSFFIPTQLRSSDLPNLIIELFSWADQDDMREKLGFDLDDYVSVIRQILASPRQKIKPTHFHRTNIKLIGGRKAPRDAILAMLSHKPGSMNADYLLPDEYGAETFSERPLVELPSNFFGLPSVSWCGAAFYEALFLALLKIEKGASQRVGDATEELVKACIRSKGIDCKAGKYSIGKISYDCDAVVETPNYIYFIEIKKKPLTRKSRGGGKADLFIDLFKSLYNSQIQALRHRLNLIKAGQLTLSEGSNQHVVSLNCRKVVSVSLTTSDYGGFQDRIFTQQFLQLVYQLGFDTDSNEARYKKAFVEINEKIKMFRKLYEDLLKIDLDEKQAMGNGQAFFHSSFMSLPQLLILLDDVYDDVSFEKAFRSILSFTTASQDFYFELAQARELSR